MLRGAVVILRRTRYTPTVCASFPDGWHSYTPCFGSSTLIGQLTRTVTPSFSPPALPPPLPPGEELLSVTPPSSPLTALPLLRNRPLTMPSPRASYLHQSSSAVGDTTGDDSLSFPVPPPPEGVPPSFGGVSAVPSGGEGVVSFPPPARAAAAAAAAAEEEGDPFSWRSSGNLWPKSPKTRAR